MKRDVWLYAIAGAVLLAVAIGALYAACAQPEASSDASDDGSWSVSYGGTSGYDAVLIDNGDRDRPGRVYVYYDEGYGSPYAGTYTTDRFLRSFELTLDALGVDYAIADADRLAEIVSSDGDGVAVAVFSGALPDTVYDGTADSRILGWISSGGTLYWAGCTVGSLIARSDGSLEGVSGSLELFTGASSCCPGGVADSADGDGWWEALRLSNSDMQYALPSDAGLAMGFRKDGYSSVVLTSLGEGQVCCVSGSLSPEQRADLAAVVASGVTSSSKLLEHDEGTVTRGTVEGMFDIPAEHGNLVAVLRLNGYDPIYGRTYDVGGEEA